MKKSSKINVVYNELRQMVGNRATPQEVLQCAHSLVELFSIENEGPKCKMHTGGLPFENRSLVSAFADGGWRIFWYEMHLGTEMEKDEWEGIKPDLLEQQINLENLTWQM